MVTATNDHSNQKSPKISNDPSLVNHDSFVAGKAIRTESSPVSDPSLIKSPKLKFCSKINTNVSNENCLVKEGDSDSLVNGKFNASEPNPPCKVESLLVVDTQPIQASVDKPAVINTDHVPEAAKINEKKLRFSITLTREEIEEDIAAIEALSGGKINASKPNPPCKAESLIVVDTQSIQASLDKPAVVNINHVPEAAKKNEKKHRFSITLSREEIEEDIAAFEALSGGKRLRRPKRDQSRSKADQRRLDRLFPGLDY